MDVYGWLLLKLVFLGLAGHLLGEWAFIMDAKSQYQWKQQTIPLWISPGYRKARLQRIADLFAEVQNRTNIRFRAFIKERDDDYISVKISTYGCYGLLGYGKGGERWINIYDECLDYRHTLLRAIYQILGFQMIATYNPTSPTIYAGGESVQTYIKFTTWKNTHATLIVDAKKSNKESVDECIRVETATSMICHQPNMEFYYWNKIYENLIHSYPYVDSIIAPNVTRRDKSFSWKRVGHEHDFFHVKRIYSKANNDPIFQFHHSAEASSYDSEKLKKMPGVMTGVSDVYCEDTLVECDFLHNSRGHCNAYQEFRYILCARTCGMCGVSLRMYYISTHHPFVYAQTKLEKDLPICSDEPNAVKNGQCDRSSLHSCLLPSFREKCRRSCGYCSEQSRVDCDFIRAVPSDYLVDHPNYNYRCQYMRAISDDACAPDETAVVNPITDCMFSCGRFACSEDAVEIDDRGYEQIPVMELYVPQNGWNFATFEALRYYQSLNP